MTNYEWVKENQEDVIQKALARNMTIHKDEVINMITNNDDVVKESIISYCSVDKHANKIVVGEMAHIDDRRYLFSYNDVAEWLDKERTLEPAYIVGTVIKNSHGDWYFYNGVKDNKHLVVDSPQYVGKKCGVIYYDESFKETFTPVRALSVSDRYTEQIYAPVHKD